MSTTDLAVFKTPSSAYHGSAAAPLDQDSDSIFVGTDGEESGGWYQMLQSDDERSVSVGTLDRLLNDEILFDKHPMVKQEYSDVTNGVPSATFDRRPVACSSVKPQGHSTRKCCVKNRHGAYRLIGCSERNRSRPHDRGRTRVLGRYHRRSARNFRQSTGAFQTKGLSARE